MPCVSFAEREYLCQSLTRREDSGRYLNEECGLTGDLFSAVVGIVLGFQAAGSAHAKLSNIHAIDAIFALAVPVLLLRCQASRSNIFDLLLYIHMSAYVDS